MNPPAPVTRTRRPLTAEGMTVGGVVIRGTARSGPGGYEDAPLVDRAPTGLSRSTATVWPVSWKVPLADVRVDEDDIAAVADVYRSGWLSMGPRIEELEEAFAAYTGAPHALAVANGTAGLHLICAAAPLGPGDEVIVPSLTFVATVNAIAYTGARP